MPWNVSSLAILEVYINKFQSLYDSNFNKFIFYCIKLRYIIAQCYQEHVLIMAKLVSVACIRADTNCTQCINSGQIKEIMGTSS